MIREVSDALPRVPSMLERHRCRDSRGHHPWRFFGEHLPDWRIEWVNWLPDGQWGETLHSEKRVLMADGLDQAERRCTLCHETGHVLRAPFRARHRLYEESLVDRQASRLLLPSVRKVGHAMAWHHGDYEKAAFDLWVDEKMLNVRLSTLAPRERLWLATQMQLILV